MRGIFERILSLILAVALVPACVLATPANALEAGISYFEDGITIVEEFENVQTFSEVVKTGTKTYTCYAKGGKVLWKAVLTATFEYDGAVADCVVAVFNTSITDHSFHTISKTNAKIGNAAYGHLTMGRDFVGATTQKSFTMKISCSPTGDLC